MIIGRPSGLGRGLGAIIPPPKPPMAPVAAPSDAMRNEPVGDQGQRVLQIPIDQIERNPHQPRVHFDHAQLEDLITSIKEHGVLQPLVVTALPDGRYELIAGERRLRASTIAGLKTVPALLRNATEQQKLELAIIENVQRQDLNPIEEAKAYVRLMEEFNLTQEEVGQKLGKSRPQVANTVRLLQLPEEIQKALMEERISASNARTLLSLPTEQERLQMFYAMIEGNFTVRQTEERAISVHHRTKIHDPNLAAAEEKLRGIYQVKTQIKREANGSGSIRLQFHSEEELNALLEKLSRL